MAMLTKIKLPRFASLKLRIAILYAGLFAAVLAVVVGWPTTGCCRKSESKPGPGKPYVAPC